MEIKARSLVEKPLPPVTLYTAGRRTEIPKITTRRLFTTVLPGIKAKFTPAPITPNNSGSNMSVHRSDKCFSVCCVNDKSDLSANRSGIPLDQQCEVTIPVVIDLCISKLFLHKIRSKMLSLKMFIALIQLLHYPRKTMPSFRTL